MFLNLQEEGEEVVGGEDLLFQEVVGEDEEEGFKFKYN